jgi:hypothetical protein
MLQGCRQQNWINAKADLNHGNQSMLLMVLVLIRLHALVYGNNVSPSVLGGSSCSVILCCFLKPSDGLRCCFLKP